MGSDPVRQADSLTRHRMDIEKKREILQAATAAGGTRHQAIE